MKNLTAIIVLIGVAVFVKIIFYSPSTEHTNLSQKEKSVNTPSSDKAYPSDRKMTQEEMSDLQKRYEELTQKQKNSIRARGFLFPQEVDPEVHTEISTHMYLQKVSVNLKTRKKIEEEIGKIEKKKEDHFKETKALMIAYPRIKPTPLNYTVWGDESLIILTPLEAYKHFSENGKRSIDRYPVKYFENDKYYVFKEWSMDANSDSSFSEGIAIGKKGGLIMRWKCPTDR